MMGFWYYVKMAFLILVALFFLLMSLLLGKIASVMKYQYKHRYDNKKGK